MLGRQPHMSGRIEARSHGCRESLCAVAAKSKLAAQVLNDNDAGKPAELVSHRLNVFGRN